MNYKEILLSVSISILLFIIAFIIYDSIKASNSNIIINNLISENISPNEKFTEAYKIYIEQYNELLQTDPPLSEFFYIVSKKIQSKLGLSNVESRILVNELYNIITAVQFTESLNFLNEIKENKPDN